MNVADLEAALPAATVSALTILSSNGAVYVSREQRAPDAPQTDPEAWWRPVDQPTAPSALGAGRADYEYELMVLDTTSGTAARSHRAAEELRQYFHGFRRPAVTRLRWTEVLFARGDALAEDVGTFVALARVVFHAEEE